MIQKKMTLGITKALFIVAFLPWLMAIWSGCTKDKPKVADVAVKTGACQVIENLPGEVTKPIEVNYDDKVKLLGISWKKVSGKQLEISYYWQLIDNPGEFTEVFVHVTDAYEKMFFQNDHTLCLNRELDNLKGKLVKQTNVVNMPESARGDAIVKIGLYDVHKSNYPRLKIKSSKGALVDDKDTRSVAGSIKFD